MKLYCLGRYHNSPAGLHFDAPGIIELDDDKARFLLRDAPENFATELPAAPSIISGRAKAPEAPARDKAVKAPGVKKHVLSDGEGAAG